MVRAAASAGNEQESAELERERPKQARAKASPAMRPDKAPGSADGVSPQATGAARSSRPTHAGKAAATGADSAPGLRRVRVLQWVVLVLATAVLLGACTWKAWVTDDAYITFRAVENFVEGRGPTWNVGERVQVYTHPLWMLTMATLRRLSGEYFYSSICLGLGLTLAAVVLVILGMSPPLSTACMGVAILVASRAFTDFSTSGLENPLTHLSLAALFVLDFKGGRRFVHHLGVFLAASACLLCRMDTGFLILPALAFYILRHRGRRLFIAAGVGLLPLVCWEVFSLFYYGFFLPNSAAAKLNSGLGGTTLAAQGLWYLLNSLRGDFVTLVATLAGAGLALRSGDRRQWVWGLGVILALLYVVHIGGDFMSGRFLTAPLWVGTLLLLRARWRPHRAWTAAAACGALAAIPYFSPFVDRQYGRDWYAPIDAHGIADERMVYDEAAMRRLLRQRSVPRANEREFARLLNERWPDDPLVERVRTWLMDSRDEWPPHSRLQPSGAPYRRVILRGAVGYLGFYLGPQAHVLDYNGIGDPLLARLPALVPDPVLAALAPPLARRGWRIGHYTRAIPAGYAQTLATGRNEIRDPRLAQYYEKLALVTRGPLFDGARLLTIWRFQRGEYDPLLWGEDPIPAAERKESPG